MGRLEKARYKQKTLAATYNRQQSLKSDLPGWQVLWERDFSVERKLVIPRCILDNTSAASTLQVRVGIFTHAADAP